MADAALELDVARAPGGGRPARGDYSNEGFILLGELLAPGGSAAKVIEARKRLDTELSGVPIVPVPEAKP